MLEKNKSENLKKTHPSQEQLKDILGHYQAGRLKDAEKLAISISQQFPNHQFAWKVLGVIFGQTGRNSEALHANQIAVSLSPQDALAHSNLGNVLKAQGRLDEALASYKQAIALKPDFAEAHYNLGNVVKAQGRLDEALASYKQAIALNPDFAIDLLVKSEEPGFKLLFQNLYMKKIYNGLKQKGYQFFTGSAINSKHFNDVKYKIS